MFSLAVVDTIYIMVSLFIFSVPSLYPRFISLYSVIFVSITSTRRKFWPQAAFWVNVQRLLYAINSYLQDIPPANKLGVLVRVHRCIGTCLVAAPQNIPIFHHFQFWSQKYFHIFVPKYFIIWVTKIIHHLNRKWNCLNWKWNYINLLMR